jgi:hypothetical protein
VRRKVMTREEKIEFLVEAVWNIEGTTVGNGYFQDWTNEQLDKEVEWFEYLYTK